MSKKDLKDVFENIKERSVPNSVLLYRILDDYAAKATPLKNLDRTRPSFVRSIFTHWVVALPALAVALFFFSGFLLSSSFDPASEVFAMEIETDEIGMDLSQEEWIFESEADLLELELFFDLEGSI